MTFTEILFIALGLAMDAFAVSLAAGTLPQIGPPRTVFRLSFHFGLFQFLMPVLGWYLGSCIAEQIAVIDHWIVLGLLSFVGIRMIRNGMDPENATYQSDPSKGLTLVALSVATSIDAFAVGLSLAFLKINIWYPSIIIGVVTSSLSILGVHLGKKIAATFGKGVVILGGLILIIIGLRIFLSHMLAE